MSVKDAFEEAYNMYDSKPKKKFDRSVLNSARPLKEHLERCTDKSVMVYGLKSYIQINPKTGADLIKDLSARELQTKVVAVRNLPTVGYIELSVNLKGEFPKKNKEDPESEQSEDDIAEQISNRIEACESNT